MSDFITVPGLTVLTAAMATPDLAVPYAAATPKEIKPTSKETTAYSYSEGCAS